MQPNILIVDDDPHARDLLRRLLSPLGKIREADGVVSAKRALADEPVDLVLTDMAMPDPSDGLSVLEATRESFPETPVVVVTAYGNIEGVLDTIQRGAFDYISKPFDVDSIVRVVRRALEQKRLL